MSISLVLGLLLGLAVGGPLYYLYITAKAKRRQAAARIQKQEMMDTEMTDSVNKEEEQEK